MKVHTITDSLSNNFSLSLNLTQNKIKLVCHRDEICTYIHISYRPNRNLCNRIHTYSTNISLKVIESLSRRDTTQSLSLNSLGLCYA